MIPKVSVIVPCYNAEKTIKSTLDSLNNQIYKDFKVILINDGSTDRTVEVIQKYIRCNPNMDIILKSCKNGGVSRARNIGLKISDTKYISFLDADDMYHPMFLKRLVNELENNKADIAMCVYCWNEFKENFKNAIVKIFAPEQLLKLYFHKRIYKLNFWCALYKRELLEQHKVSFSNGMKYGEDSEFFCKYLYHCKKAVFIKEELYCYIDRCDSAQHIITYEKTQNIDGFARVLDYWGAKAPDGSEYIVARAIWSCLKDFAMGKGTYYKKIQAEYDVKNAMKILVKMEKEKVVKYSSLVYLVHPFLFKTIFVILLKFKCLNMRKLWLK